MTRNRTVLVTGGNRGIGLAIVERFATEGILFCSSGAMKHPSRSGRGA